MKIFQLGNASQSQMMGYLIVTEHGHIIAVDGGTRQDTGEFHKIVKSYGGHMDFWLITHPHYDHYSVLAELTEHPDPEIQADCVLYSPAPKPYTLPDWELADNLPEWDRIREHCPYPMREVFRGDSFQSDNVRLDILRAVNPDDHAGDINHLSVVLMLTEQISAEKQFKLLFLGDLGAVGGEELLRLYADSPERLRADAVQMAHHGQNGVNLPVYQAIAPRYTFWPTPDWLWNNLREGKPGPWKTLEVRRWMEELHAVPITSLHGTTVFDTCQI